MVQRKQASPLFSSKGFKSLKTVQSKSSNKKSCNVNKYERSLLNQTVSYLYFELKLMFPDIRD